MVDELAREVSAMQACFKILSQLDKEEQERVLAWLQGKLALRLNLLPGPTSPGSGIPPPGQGPSPTAKAFLAFKRPATDVQRITCLAFFLTRYGDKPRFKTRDLSALNADAAQPRLSNPTVAVNNATRSYNFLAPAGGGLKQITARGEAVVEALPDPLAVQGALKAHPMKVRRSRGARNGKGATPREKTA